MSHQASSKERQASSDNPIDRGFLNLAREWNHLAVETGPNQCLTAEADQAAMACLLISKERHAHLSAAAKNQIEANYKLRLETPFRICDSLLWELCAAAFHRVPSQAPPIRSLVLLLGHQNSGLRMWGFEMGWVVRDWLPADRVLPILFKNVADTLGGVDQAIGLATSFFETRREFLETAEAFDPEPSFSSQYFDRISQVEEHGIERWQTPFLRTEIKIRKAVEDRCLG